MNLSPKPDNPMVKPDHPETKPDPPEIIKPKPENPMVKPSPKPKTEGEATSWPTTDGEPPRYVAGSLTPVNLKE